jgi:hypothetical protein
MKLKKIGQNSRQSAMLLHGSEWQMLKMNNQDEWEQWKRQEWVSSEQSLEEPTNRYQ